MPVRKSKIKKRAVKSKRKLKKRRRPTKKLYPHSALVDLVRELCYSYGMAMARLEFKGKIPKPSIDEFRERIVHHMFLIESSMRNKLTKEVGKSLEQAKDMLNTRVRLDAQKIRNGIITEVETIYESI